MIFLIPCGPSLKQQKFHEVDDRVQSFVRHIVCKAISGNGGLKHVFQQG